MTSDEPPAALIVGASRGIGAAMVEELLRRGWAVTGTVRDGAHTPLHTLRERYAQQLRIEPVDINRPEQVDELQRRLRAERFELLFVNAGVASGRNESIADVSTDEFVQLMLTNTLSPMRVLERLAGSVRPHGVLGVMSSGQGSITDNLKGQFEIYRASKAALNMLMRSFAARHGDEHALLLLAPGWIKTQLGGATASFTVQETIGDIVDTILAQRGRRGLQYLDRFGKPVSW